MADSEALVKDAYEEFKERIVKGLEGDLRFRDGVVEKSDGAYEVVWAEMRKKGIPDRRAERDAIRQLLEQVRCLEFGLTPQEPRERPWEYVLGPEEVEG